MVSSAVDSWRKPQCWLKALSYISSFHRVLSTTAMSTDVSQVGVGLFPSFISFHAVSWFITTKCDNSRLRYANNHKLWVCPSPATRVAVLSGEITRLPALKRNQQVGISVWVWRIQRPGVFTGSASISIKLSILILHCNVLLCSLHYVKSSLT